MRFKFRCKITFYLPLLAFILAALFSANSAYAVSFDGSGNGTAQSPYQISTMVQMTELASLVNAGNERYASARYELTGDINADGSWTPIGTQTNPFRGKFDGKGHKILNPRYSGGAGSSYIGLFGYVSGGAISNLGVETGSFSGQDYVGGVAGGMPSSASGSVTNCYSTGVISGVNFVGGIAGSINSKGSVNNSVALNSSVARKEGDSSDRVFGYHSLNAKSANNYGLSDMQGERLPYVRFSLNSRNNFNLQHSEEAFQRH
jgi:hypothetical protein